MKERCYSAFSVFVLTLPSSDCFKATLSFCLSSFPPLLKVWMHLSIFVFSVFPSCLVPKPLLIYHLAANSVDCSCYITSILRNEGKVSQYLCEC